MKKKAPVNKEHITLLANVFERQQSQIERTGVNRLGKLQFIPFPQRPTLKFIPDAETSHALIMATIIDHFADFNLTSNIKSGYTSVVISKQNSESELNSLN